MASSPTPQVVRTYLDQLEATLSGVREDVRRDIVAGVAEELRGLSAPDAAARIEALGDPAFIAAEARAEAAAPGAAEPRRREPQPVLPASGDARWYVVLAALLVAFGGVVIPVIGWIVGIALVLAVEDLARLRRSGSRRLTPFAAVAPSVLISCTHPGSSSRRFPWMRGDVPARDSGQRDRRHLAALAGAGRARSASDSVPVEIGCRGARSRPEPYRSMRVYPLRAGTTISRPSNRRKSRSKLATGDA